MKPQQQGKAVKFSTWRYVVSRVVDANQSRSQKAKAKTGERQIWTCDQSVELSPNHKGSILLPKEKGSERKDLANGRNLTQQWWLDPVTIAHLQEVVLASLGVRHIQGRDVQHNLLSVRCGDAPVTQRLRTLSAHHGVLFLDAGIWGTEDAAGILQRASATWKEKRKDDDFQKKCFQIQCMFIWMDFQHGEAVWQKGNTQRLNCWMQKAVCLPDFSRKAKGKRETLFWVETEMNLPVFAGSVLCWFQALSESTYLYRTGWMIFYRGNSGLQTLTLRQEYNSLKVTKYQRVPRKKGQQIFVFLDKILWQCFRLITFRRNNTLSNPTDLTFFHHFFFAWKLQNSIVQQCIWFQENREHHKGSSFSIISYRVKRLVKELEPDNINDPKHLSCHLWQQ